MKLYMTKILGFDVLGAKILALVSATWALVTKATYDSTIHRYFDFCDEHKLAPLVWMTANMGTWLGTSRG
jgi:hypothetical protein